MPPEGRDINSLPVRLLAYQGGTGVTALRNVAQGEGGDAEAEG